VELHAATLNNGGSHVGKDGEEGEKAEGLADTHLHGTGDDEVDGAEEETLGSSTIRRQPTDDLEGDSNHTKNPSPGPESANPFTMDRLHACIQTFHRLSKGELEAAGLLLSEIAQYPLPPRVVKRILNHETTSPATVAQGSLAMSHLTKAILDSAEIITPQWYIEPLERHSRRLEHVINTMDLVGPRLREWHEDTEGRIEMVGLLLAQLAPEPDKGSLLPTGMIRMLLRIEKEEKTCSWAQLSSCLSRSMDIQDSAASIIQILDETAHPATQGGLRLDRPLEMEILQSRTEYVVQERG